MEFFSEIYGCYYKIVSEILKHADQDSITKQEIMNITEQFGFVESILTVPDKLCSDVWHLLEKTESGSYDPLLMNPPHIPMTLLQKRWLKSLLSDRRIRLFFDDTQLSEINEALLDVEPLWKDEHIYYYDRYESGDDFASEEYRHSFQSIINACQKKSAISFDYTSAKGKHTQKACLPLKIEYSSKNDRFRLIALRCPFDQHFIIDRYRLDGIKNVTISDTYTDEVIKRATTMSLDTLFRQSYDTEPVRLIIENRRNALERTMLHFANYDKDTKQLDDNTWECCIYYDSSMETELLIEILSFGPVVRVVGPDSFVTQIRGRLKRQLEFFSS